MYHKRLIDNYLNEWSQTSDRKPLLLRYWHREAANSNAEVDYVIQQGAGLFPVEIKASGKGSMQSLRQFLHDKERPFGYRFSLENFSEYQGVKSYPLYAVSNLVGRAG